jgi:hypothetical protein
MPHRPDIVIRDKGDRAIALVEVKKSRDFTDRQAAEYMEWLRDAGYPDEVRYLLIVSPTRIYWWDRETMESARTATTREPEVRVLPAFLAERVSSDKYDERTMEYAVFQWLLDWAENEEKHNDPAEEALKDLGFLAALRDSQVRFGRSE